MDAFTLDGPLEGHNVRLDRLTIADAENLRAVSQLDDFRYYVNLMPRSMNPEDFRQFIAEVAGNPHRIAVVARHVESGVVLGCSSWMDLRPDWRCLEIGLTWIAEPWRGTWVNPAMKRLMLGQAFDRWDCVRVALKCDARNEHSQAAIAKLGAQREGVLRQYGIQPDGTVRDTVMFSVLRDEWPGVRAGLDQRLSDLAGVTRPAT